MKARQLMKRGKYLEAASLARKASNSVGSYLPWATPFEARYFKWRKASIKSYVANKHYKDAIRALNGDLGRLPESTFKDKVSLLQEHISSKRAGFIAGVAKKAHEMIWHLEGDIMISELKGSDYTPIIALLDEATVTLGETPPRLKALRNQAVQGQNDAYEYERTYAEPSYSGDSSFDYDPGDSGGGSVVMCKDGSISYSGGKQGACSYHGGVAG